MAVERRIVSIASGAERLILPVTPVKYQVQTAQDNKILEILDFGELLVFGNPRLSKLKFGSFFPALKHRYPFVVGDKREPEECIALLQKWRTSKAAVRVIITQSPVNMMVAVMGLDYREQDGSRDIYYDLTLTEYKDLNVTQSNNEREVDSSGLKTRPVTGRDSTQQQRFISDAQDEYEAAKHIAGSFDYDSYTRLKGNDPLTRLEAGLEYLRR